MLGWTCSQRLPVPFTSSLLVFFNFFAAFKAANQIFLFQIFSLSFHKSTFSFLCEWLISLFPFLWCMHIKMHFLLSPSHYHFFLDLLVWLKWERATQQEYFPSLPPPPSTFSTWAIQPTNPYIQLPFQIFTQPRFLPSPLVLPSFCPPSLAAVPPLSLWSKSQTVLPTRVFI